MIIINSHYKNSLNNTKMDSIMNTILIISAVVFGVGIIFFVLGFRSSGISGDSYASHRQASIGNVIVGSIFAIFQFLGAIKVFKAMIYIGGIGLIISGIYYLFESFVLSVL
jgi:hypothetical protein